ncbi:MAG: YidC/Oxa1 family membrane protein insertase [Treponema sp.]|jgi:membrane protein insertase Oxa1/YidC/SpoIIIJ|nr:YidC/Oxa1 family membrane protein insertase [Treponema sp.]
METFGMLFFNSFIFPLTQIIETVYVLAFRLLHSHGLAIVAMSCAVSALYLPLAALAEKQQEQERALQKKLAPKIKKIKAVFTGDERYLILSVLYRQNHWHPAYAFRSSLGVLFVIPFFIAAYSFLSHLSALRGVSFWCIRDMSAPDRLFDLGGLPVNVLPLLMTLINGLSGAVYDKAAATGDKVRLWGTARIFLVLLYNSPAALTIYWTMNNLLSLAKNLLAKLPKKRTDSQRETQLLPASAGNFALSLGILFVLTGIALPGFLLASSPGEFSFIGTTRSPFPLWGVTVIQSAGILLWGGVVYGLCPPGRVRRRLSLCAVLCAFWALTDAFLIPENFGYLTNTLIFSDPRLSPSSYKWFTLNILLLAGVTAGSLVLFRLKKTALLTVIQLIVLMSLAGFGAVNAVKVYQGFSVERALKETGYSASGLFAPQFTFTKTGKNVLVIMLDQAISGYVPAIFQEKPELNACFSGFVWYPNCVSFAGHTFAGAPPLYGGYEYTPQEINRRGTVSLADKHREAYLLLPRLFSEAGWQVIVTDPPFDCPPRTNLSIFTAYPRIQAKNIMKNYAPYWLGEHPETEGINIAGLLYRTLSRFSLFKTVPVFLRLFLYDGGYWLTAASLLTGEDVQGGLTETVIADYAFFETLPRITAVNSGADTYTALYGHLAHSASFLQAPDYIPVREATNRGNSLFADEAPYHMNIASFLLLGKWFDFLKAQGVYDNTRIIIVSDHGVDLHSPFPNNIKLPNGKSLELYNALLLVKDFYAPVAVDGALSEMPDFMTNADTPLLAIQDLLENPANPFTRNPLTSAKAQGVTITTIPRMSSGQHTHTKYKIRPNQYLRVRDTIFNLENWTK